MAAYTTAADEGTVETLLGVNALGLDLTNYAGLDATGKTDVGTALFTARAGLTTQPLIQTAEQGLVDAVILVTTTTWGTSSKAGEAVVPDAQSGYSFTFVSSDNLAVVDVAGKVSVNGSATLTYTVTNASSGKTATKTLYVTVVVD